jgi:thiamine-phosphate pyrophosphorylase
VTFVVNDDIEAALMLGADGVHLGRTDEGAERAREQGLLLGLSATNLQEARAADGNADYIGVGPVWETPSKADADPAIGPEGLREICGATKVPVIAIGGIDAANAAECIRAGAVGVAVIRAARDAAALRAAIDAAL